MGEEEAGPSSWGCRVGQVQGEAGRAESEGENAPLDGEHLARRLQVSEPFSAFVRMLRFVLLALLSLTTFHSLGLTCSSEPPFDRHDWIIRRPSTQTEHRYIIDYYSAPDDPDGSPNFNLDVRPALDDLGSARMRFSAYMDEWRSGEKEDYKA
jgi:hypothetical protein